MSAKSVQIETSSLCISALIQDHISHKKEDHMTIHQKLNKIPIVSFGDRHFKMMNSVKFKKKQYDDTNITFILLI